MRLVPPAGWRDALSSKLCEFPPHDLNELCPNDERMPSDLSGYESVVSEYRRRNDQQLAELVRSLGLNLADPNVWQKAFFKLAMFYCGVGHLSWKPPRGSNRRAAKWTSEQDQLLYREMLKRIVDGKEDTEAAEEIANTAEIWQQLPQSNGTRFETPSHSRRAGNFRKRWSRLKKTAPPDGLLRAIVGDFPINGTESDRSNWRRYLDDVPPLPDGKI